MLGVACEVNHVRVDLVERPMMTGFRVRGHRANSEPDHRHSRVGWSGIENRHHLAQWSIFVMVRKRFATPWLIYKLSAVNSVSAVANY